MSRFPNAHLYSPNKHCVFQTNVTECCGKKNNVKGKKEVGTIKNVSTNLHKVFSVNDVTMSGTLLMLKKSYLCWLFSL